MLSSFPPVADEKSTANDHPTPTAHPDFTLALLVAHKLRRTTHRTPSNVSPSREAVTVDEARGDDNGIDCCSNDDNSSHGDAEATVHARLLDDLADRPAARDLVRLLIDLPAGEFDALWRQHQKTSAQLQVPVPQSQSQSQSQVPQSHVSTTTAPTNDEDVVCESWDTEAVARQPLLTVRPGREMMDARTTLDFYEFGVAASKTASAASSSSSPRLGSAVTASSSPARSSSSVSDCTSPLRDRTESDYPEDFESYATGASIDIGMESIDDDHVRWSTSSASSPVLSEASLSSGDEILSGIHIPREKRVYQARCAGAGNHRVSEGDPFMNHGYQRLNDSSDEDQPIQQSTPDGGSSESAAIGDAIVRDIAADEFLADMDVDKSDGEYGSRATSPMAENLFALAAASLARRQQRGIDSASSTPVSDIEEEMEMEEITSIDGFMRQRDARTRSYGQQYERSDLYATATAFSTTPSWSDLTSLRQRRVDVAGDEGAVTHDYSYVQLEDIVVHADDEKESNSTPAAEIPEHSVPKKSKKKGKGGKKKKKKGVRGKMASKVAAESDDDGSSDDAEEAVCEPITEHVQPPAAPEEPQLSKAALKRRRQAAERKARLEEEERAAQQQLKEVHQVDDIDQQLVAIAEEIVAEKEEANIVEEVVVEDVSKAAEVTNDVIIVEEEDETVQEVSISFDSGASPAPVFESAATHDAQDFAEHAPSSPADAAKMSSTLHASATSTIVHVDLAPSLTDWGTSCPKSDHTSTALFPAPTNILAVPSANVAEELPPIHPLYMTTSPACAHDSVTTPIVMLDTPAESPCDRVDAATASNVDALETLRTIANRLPTMPRIFSSDDIRSKCVALLMKGWNSPNNVIYASTTAKYADVAPANEQPVHATTDRPASTHIQRSKNARRNKKRAAVAGSAALFAH